MCRLRVLRIIWKNLARWPHCTSACIFIVPDSLSEPEASAGVLWRWPRLPQTVSGGPWLSSRSGLETGRFQFQIYSFNDLVFLDHVARNGTRYMYFTRTWIIVGNTFKKGKIVLSLIQTASLLAQGWEYPVISLLLRPFWTPNHSADPQTSPGPMRAVPLAFRPC